MKIFKGVILLTFIFVGLLFARSDREVKRLDSDKTKQVVKYYWVKDHAELDDNKLDRKRTHKRRRKIKKPVKGLR
tara:strand:+ start:387 stop:611 length:225 start_codon:yes stop_codon:yes gene_type:complete